VRCPLPGVASGSRGGWGVDTLLGRQTRAHRDVDIDIDIDAVHEEVAPQRGFLTASPARAGRADNRRYVRRKDHYCSRCTLLLSCLS
jgi:hypothetical protein